MIMILLVTAYNREVEQERRQDNSKSYTQSYSKYLPQPRVRTAFLLASLPVFLVIPCWWTRHLAASRRTRHMKQQVIAPQ